jgi:hypothetical protein
MRTATRGDCQNGKGWMEVFEDTYVIITFVCIGLFCPDGRFLNESRVLYFLLVIRSSD